MALGFNDTNGSAVKSAVNHLKIEGSNRVRLFGGIQPSYVYWLKNSEGKMRPFECLQFDRASESFKNGDPDPVKEYIDAHGLTDNGNEIRCKWSYKILCYNYATEQVELFTLRKGLLSDLFSMNMQLKKKMNNKAISPTNTDDTGYDFVFTKEKTGPRAYDVKYSVDPFSVEFEAVSPEILSKIEEAKNIDEILPRSTAEDQRKELEKFFAPSEDSEDNSEEGSEEATDLPTNFGG